MLEHPNLKYLRKGVLPHMFCPGCACGQILNAYIYAIDELDLDLDKVVTIGGVGCMSRAPAYINTDAIHGIHGRNLAYATGIKLANPELTVVSLMGDGDCAAIGGNHLIQAARRNLDVTVIVNNNGGYAMTGGQVSPMTPTGATTTTTTRGNIERPFDLCKLVETAGGTYISRWTAAHSIPLANSMKKGIKHKGFSFIEVIGQCPTQYGRYVLGLRSPIENLSWLRDNSVTKKQAEKMSEDELKGKIIVGDLVEKELPKLIDGYFELERRCRVGT
jgi:2-oxoglutarate ferredoxin oxidoreductase subunit beta